LIQELQVTRNRVSHLDDPLVLHQIYQKAVEFLAMSQPVVVENVIVVLSG
jgi:hypothetical protein